MKIRLSILAGLVVGQWMAALMASDPETVKRMSLRAEGATILALTLVGATLLLEHFYKKLEDQDPRSYDQRRKP